MQQKKRYNVWHLIIIGVVIASMILPSSIGQSKALASSSYATQETITPLAASTWCVAGGFQGWDNASMPLYDDGTHGDLFNQDGIFTLDAVISSPGDYEWKAVECGNWNVAFPAANSWFTTTTVDQTVKLTLDTNDYTGNAGALLLPAHNIVNVWNDTLPSGFTAVGSFQGWNNSDPNTQMSNLGNGLFYLAYPVATAGSYIGKVVATGSWRAFGADGRSADAANVEFVTGSDNQVVAFLLDTNSGRLTITPHGTGSGNWCVAGGFQGWDNASTVLYDDGSHGDLIGGDGVFSLDFTVPTAGRNEWKAVKCGDWGVAYPSDNAWVVTSQDQQTVKFTFDTNDHSANVGLPYQPVKNIVNAWDSLPQSWTAAGSFNGWNNADPVTSLSNLGYQTWLLNLPFDMPGSYEGKITQTGTWDNQFGADGRNKNAPGIAFQIFNTGDTAQFVLNSLTGRIAVLAPPQGGHGQDNNVEYNGLGHNSQDTLYRVPFGAITPGTLVTLRFRTYHNDVSQVRVRIWDSVALKESLKEMTIAASDVSCYDASQIEESCDFWQLSYTPTTLTTLWYRFIVKDGTATAYYADDKQMTGGWGVATPSMVDNSYAITVYDPAFQPSAWMQDAVVYQVFPDRFRNGRTGNDPTGEENRYGFPPEPLDQIVVKEWSELPEGYCRYYVNPAEPCTEQPRGRDYFGGDLIGLRQQLPYLNGSGIKVIYLNPIFEAGSNHNYDTRDYEYINQFFGENQDFVALATAAHRRGMKIIIDGVFNHMSSDSPVFDRYHHFESVGACESLESPYRDWFTFTEVTPGTGSCVGTSGANSANYDSWYGFDSLPVLNKYNSEVKELIFRVAQQWLVMGADGWRLDVMPDASFPPGFWQEFRAKVLEVKPEAVIIGELWKKGDVLPFVHGDQADSTMDYRFRNAVLGFLGKIDNKGFPDDGESDQPPSTFASKLVSIREDYPDATYYTLMRLVDSHDTQRILWSLTPGENNREDKEFNSENLARGKQMLRLAAIMQMTVPGAATIYYGDEVGVTGDDDPDDRRTFPWKDEGSALSGGSKSLAAESDGAAGDLQLLAFYRKLISLRNSRPVLRDGSMTFLLADDTSRTLAYVMRTETDAVIVAFNRSDTTQALNIDVTGLLPQNFQAKDFMGLVGSQAAVNGVMTFELPSLGAAILLARPGQDLARPEAPVTLVAEPGNMQVALAWEGVADAARYSVYRSPVSGGGYVWLADTSDTSYLDTTVINGKRYYYSVRTWDAAGNLSDFSAEIGATPYYPIGWAGLQWPHSIEHVISVNPTENVYGQVYVPGITDSGGDPTSILAELGYGVLNSDPASWDTWKRMAHNASCNCGNNFEYMANMRPEETGSFSYLVRFSTDGGIHWTYGYWSDGTAGTLTVQPNSDTTVPAAPANLRASNWSSDYITLEWDAVADAAEYWLYRSNTAGSYGDRLATVIAPETSYTDNTVDLGTTYFYVVAAVDAALNVSEPSNEVSQTATPKLVDVTFQVLVPGETPPDATVYIAGGTPPLEWNPGKFPMTKVGDRLWEITLQFLDGTSLEYKFTRGSWEKVEWWGSIVSVANRRVAVTYGTDGRQLVQDISTDWGTGADDDKAVQYWRDPLVTSTSPVDGFSGIAPAAIAATFARDVQPLQGGDYSSSIVVDLGGAVVPGTVGSTDNLTLVWTPSSSLVPGTYKVTVINVRSNLSNDSVPMQAPYVFSFTVTSQLAGNLGSGAYRVYIPILKVEH